MLHSTCEHVTHCIHHMYAGAYCVCLYTMPYINSIRMDFVMPTMRSQYQKKLVFHAAHIATHWTQTNFDSSLVSFHLYTSQFLLVCIIDLSNRVGKKC